MLGRRVFRYLPFSATGWRYSFLYSNGGLSRKGIFPADADGHIIQEKPKKIPDEMDEKQDSLRFYLLGNRYESKVEHYGVKENFDLQTDTLLL